MSTVVADALALAQARAQSRLDRRLREHIQRFLAESPPMCEMCPRESRSRYPDCRCAEHTVYLSGRTGLERRQQDNDRALYLRTWQSFFERIERIRRT